MLIISRRVGQSIVLGNDIEITVVALSRKVVKIGIDAPRGRTVLRGEVKDSIAAANRAALDSQFDDAALLATVSMPAAAPGLATSSLAPLPTDAASARAPERRQAGAAQRQVTSGARAASGPEIVVRRRIVQQEPSPAELARHVDIERRGQQ